MLPEDYTGARHKGTLDDGTEFEVAAGDDPKSPKSAEEVGDGQPRDPDMGQQEVNEQFDGDPTKMPSDIPPDPDPKKVAADPANTTDPCHNNGAVRDA